MDGTRARGWRRRANGKIRTIVKIEDVTTLVGYPARESIVCVNVSAMGLADPEYAQKT